MKNNKPIFKVIIAGSRQRRMHKIIVIKRICIV